MKTVVRIGMLIVSCLVLSSTALPQQPQPAAPGSGSENRAGSKRGANFESAIDIRPG